MFIYIKQEIPFKMSKWHIDRFLVGTTIGKILDILPFQSLDAGKENYFKWVTRRLGVRGQMELMGQRR